MERLVNSDFVPRAETRNEKCFKTLYKYNEVIINPRWQSGDSEDFDNTDFTLPNLPYTYD